MRASAPDSIRRRRVGPRAEGNRGPRAEVLRGKADAAAFAARPGHLAEFVEEQRLKPFHRWHAYSQKLRKDPSLVAYYTFELRGRDPTREPSILPNVAATGEALDGRIEGPRWTEGRFPGKSALQFSGPEWNDHVVLPEPERFNFTGPFSVAVWFKVGRFTVEHQALITNETTWRLQRCFGENVLTFDTNHGGGVDKTVGRRMSPIAAGIWRRRCVPRPAP